MDSFVRGDLRFEVLDEGPRDGEKVAVLLHGFPQDATAWSSVSPPLNRAGLRTLAPHLRGLSPHARPRPRSAYRLGTLVGDVLALLDAAGLARVHLVGHDWGGALAWQLAMHYPERVQSLTALSIPHPRAMAWAMLRSKQGLMSWYMAAMQLPWLPEQLFSRNIANGGMSRLGLPPSHAHAYTARMSEPGALRGAINWYRGLMLGSRLPRATTVTTPTTLVWGRRDPYLARAAAERTAHECVGDYRFIELDEGHWLPECRPDEVVTAVLERAAGTELER